MRDGIPGIVPCPAFKRSGITQRMGGTCERFGKRRDGVDDGICVRAGIRFFVRGDAV